MAEQTNPFRDALTRIANDQGLAANVTMLNQRFQTTMRTVADIDQLDTVDYSYGSVADLILTSINGSHGLPEQTVRVEYLRNDQRLIIPAALGMHWSNEQGVQGLVRANAILRDRYWKVARLTYDEINDILDAASSQAEVQEVVDAKARVPLTARVTAWFQPAFLTAGGTVDRPKSDAVFGLLSRALQFNCDLRDYGYLLTDGATVTDNAWENVAEVTADRLSVKLRPFTLHTISAMNMAPCNESELGAWVRAYGLALGIYPSRTSATMSESSFTTRMPTSESIEAIRRFERTYEDLMLPICGNILSIFGLLHLNKDHTYRTGDENMDRIGTSYLQTLRTSATAAMLEGMAQKKEVILRTAPHPFGLAQTYWLAQVMHRTGRLMPALDKRHDTTPPPIQRVMIILTAVKEWEGNPIGHQVSSTFRDKIEILAQAATLIKAHPPRYSDLARLYGQTTKLVLDEATNNAIAAMMPVAYGYAMAYHCADNRTKDGLALAQSLNNVEREMKGQATGWRAAWESFMERLEKFGIETYLAAVQEQAQRQAPQ